MLLLNYWIIIFLLCCIDLTQSKNLVTRILLFDRLDFSFIHMIENKDFLFYEIYCHFSNLLFCRLFRIFLELSWHFLNFNSTYMIIIIIWIFCCIHFIFSSFFECNTLWYQSIISILIKLNSFLSNFLDSFN